jgi:hypothetical protein
MGEVKRKTWLFVVLVIVLLAAVLAVVVVNRPAAGVAEKKADFSLSAADLIQAFSENEAEADRLYSGKVLEVHGKVKEIISHETAPILIIGNTGGTMNVSCYLQAEKPDPLAEIQEGDDVKVKGICNGMLTDVMLDKAMILTQ